MNRRDFLALTSIGFASTILRPRPSISGETKRRKLLSSEIVSAKIYPAIGLCRVGGSNKWFLSPEVPGLPPQDEDNYKDGNSLIKKQVQKFRIYGFNNENQVVKEITTDDADIEWSAHLANTKAAWYEFHNPLDNGKLAPGIAGKKRNLQVKDETERNKQLVVNGGNIKAKGANINKNGEEEEYQFNGEFLGQQKVHLGELRTDNKGRLMVFPGDGLSISPTKDKITSFADNNNWIDDWCDGPVQATVRLKGKPNSFEAESAWVAAVGPNYAPEITPIVTMYDVIENLNFKNGWVEAESKVSFRKDIYPILQRLDLMKWVAHASLLRSAWADLGPLSNPIYLRQLSSNSDKDKQARTNLLSKIRAPINQVGSNSTNTMNDKSRQAPWMHGDGVNYKNSPLHMLSITDLQYEKLEAWANGNFTSDYSEESAEEIHTFEDIPVHKQPQALTEAALESCSGGGFHPGVELTYNLRHSTLYQRYYDTTKEPCRIALGNRKTLTQDLGPELTPNVLLTKNLSKSPIGKQMPGDLTRWMGIPWQCDAFSCQSVDSDVDFPTATWWPAQVPIDVLPEEFYLQAINSNLSIDQRILFSNQRMRWSRRVAGVGYHANQSYWDGIENMISLWQTMGFVVRKPPSTTKSPLSDKSILDEDFFVEVGRDIVDMKSPSDMIESNT